MPEFRSVQEIEVMVDAMNDEPGLCVDGEEYRAAVVLVTECNLGPDLERIAEFTGYPGSFLAKIDENCRLPSVRALERRRRLPQLGRRERRCGFLSSVSTLRFL